MTRQQKVLDTCGSVMHGISFSTSAISSMGGRVKVMLKIGISFSTSAISISGGRVKVILKMDVFILVS